jgi:hypothetical protein
MQVHPPPSVRSSPPSSRLYAVAYHMSGTRNDAFERLREVMPGCRTGARTCSPRRSPATRSCSQLARHIEEILGRKAEKSFQILDDILRDDITHPIDINTRGIDGDFAASTRCCGSSSGPA